MAERPVVQADRAADRPRIGDRFGAVLIVVAAVLAGLQGRAPLSEFRLRLDLHPGDDAAKDRAGAAARHAADDARRVVGNNGQSLNGAVEHPAALPVQSGHAAQISGGVVGQIVVARLHVAVLIRPAILVVFIVSVDGAVFYGNIIQRSVIFPRGKAQIRGQEAGGVGIRRVFAQIILIGGQIAADQDLPLAFRRSIRRQLRRGDGGRRNGQVPDDRAAGKALHQTAVQSGDRAAVSVQRAGEGADAGGAAVHVNAVFQPVMDIRARLGRDGLQVCGGLDEIRVLKGALAAAEARRRRGERQKRQDQRKDEQDAQNSSFHGSSCFYPIEWSSAGTRPAV